MARGLFLGPQRQPVYFWHDSRRTPGKEADDELNRVDIQGIQEPQRPAGEDGETTAWDALAGAVALRGDSLRGGVLVNVAAALPNVLQNLICS